MNIDAERRITNDASGAPVAAWRGTTSGIVTVTLDIGAPFARAAPVDQSCCFWPLVVM